MNITRLLAPSILALSILTISAQAQAPAAGGTTNNGGGRREGGRPNMEEYRKRMEEGIKTALKATDEEWTVLKPLIENVQTKQRDTYSGRGFGGGRPGGGNNNGNGGTAGTETPRPGQAESEALKATLENDSSTPEEVKAKLAAVRATRKSAQASLTQAREELRKVLTVRQEAALVRMGMLE